MSYGYKNILATILSKRCSIFGLLTCISCQHTIELGKKPFYDNSIRNICLSFSTFIIQENVFYISYKVNRNIFDMLRKSLRSALKSIKRHTVSDEF